MKILVQPSLWVATATLIVWAMSEYVLGNEANRNLLAALSVLVCVIYATRNLPHALSAFRHGGRQRNWRLLMGNVLFPYGFAAREIWGWMVRDADRPEWMINHWLNGFFTLWILGGILLCYSASLPADLPVQQNRVYYAILLIAVGILIGIFVSRLLP